MRFLTVDGKFARVTVRYQGKATHDQILTYLQSLYGSLDRTPGQFTGGSVRVLQLDRVREQHQSSIRDRHGSWHHLLRKPGTPPQNHRRQLSHRVLTAPLSLYPPSILLRDARKAFGKTATSGSLYAERYSRPFSLFIIHRSPLIVSRLTGFFSILQKPAPIELRRPPPPLLVGPQSPLFRNG